MGEPSMGTAKPYRGDSRAIVKSTTNWFCSDDVPTDKWESGLVVQIEAVLERRGVKFVKGKAREAELTLKFAGMNKELRVNMTIRRVLDQLFTPDADKWWGQWIVLFVEQGVKAEGGEIKTGVRVRNTRPRPPTWSRAEALKWLADPAQKAATKKCAAEMGLTLAVAKDFLALTDDQVRELDKRVQATPVDDDASATAADREPGADG